MSVAQNIKRVVRNPLSQTALSILDKMYVYLSTKQLYSEIIKFDFTAADLEANRTCIEFGKKFDKKPESAIWFVPAFKQKFAGISTIFKIAGYLSSNGIKQHFVFLGDAIFAKQNGADVLEGNHGTELKNSEISINPNLKSLKHADVAFGTRWDTVYSLMKFNNVYKKVYLIQDDERLFYPAGELRSLAEEIYRFGFLGITNSMSLRDMYINEFGGECYYFFQPINEAFFSSRQRDITKIKKIWFYSRKRVKRNGFALGILGLREIKRRHPEVEIVFAGDNTTKPKDFTYKDFGYLNMDTYKKLLDDSDVGLYFIFSNHPGIIPFENMARSCITITNRRFKNSELKDSYNCIMCDPTPSSVADAFDKIFYDNKLRKNIINNGLKTVRSKFGGNYTEVMDSVFKL